MKVLFIGGSGFISTSVSRLAVAKGHDLFWLNRGQRQVNVPGVTVISAASAYQKPPSHPIITESTPLYNPVWPYSQNKIACELRLLQAYRDESFPTTIVRPSLTYGDRNFPIAIGGWDSYTLIDRIKTGRPIIVHGDGSS